MVIVPSICRDRTYKFRHVCVCVCASHFFSEPACWFFLLFGMKLGVKNAKTIAFLFFLSKILAFVFWPFFVQKWPNLAQNSHFQLFVLTLRYIRLIFGIETKIWVYYQKQPVVMPGKFSFLIFWPFCGLFSGVNLVNRVFSGPSFYCIIS